MFEMTNVLTSISTACDIKIRRKIKSRVNYLLRWSVCFCVLTFRHLIFSKKTKTCQNQYHPNGFIHIPPQWFKYRNEMPRIEKNFHTHEKNHLESTWGYTWIKMNCEHSMIESKLSMYFSFSMLRVFYIIYRIFNCEINLNGAFFHQIKSVDRILKRSDSRAHFWWRTESSRKNWRQRTFQFNHILLSMLMLSFVEWFNWYHK